MTREQTPELQALETLRAVVKENYPAWNGNRKSFLEDCDIIEAALRKSPTPDGWRNIESAPKDGTHILVWNPDRMEPEVAWWMDGHKWNWETYDNAYLDAWAEYWQPLPAAPNPETIGEE